MPGEDLPTVEQLVAVLYAALGAADMKGVKAALICIAAQDPYRAESLIDDMRAALALLNAVDEGRLGDITRDDLRAWAADDGA